MKKARFPIQSVKLFDWWLGTRRQNTLSSLNPLQFSLDCEIDVQHTLKLFSHAVFDPEIALLRRKYTVFCPRCTHKVFKSNDIIENNELHCDNCGTVIKPHLIQDFTELTFELLKVAQPLESNYPNLHPLGGAQGNAQSLRISDMNRYINNDDDIRRLYDCL
ncbi:hypothetical protein [Neobacillus endophyticus]|uniref:hypothetical protein n=1 Tax=Neobacillus endophyticus TaxID=2738405 RepID=UPI001C257AF7|nr:hypothetical protein [Neobacillus endophyticus]